MPKLKGLQIRKLEKGELESLLIQYNILYIT